MGDRGARRDLGLSALSGDVWVSMKEVWLGNGTAATDISKEPASARPIVTVELRTDQGI